MYMFVSRRLFLSQNSDEEIELKRFDDIPDGVMSVTQDIRKIPIDRGERL